MGTRWCKLGVMLLTLLTLLMYSCTDSSIAPLLDVRRRLKAVMDVLGAMVQYGVSLARSVELTAEVSLPRLTGQMLADVV